MARTATHSKIVKKKPRKPSKAKTTALTKKLSELSNKAILESGLNQNQEEFCRFYVLNPITRNNGTLSYAAAHKYELDDLPDDDARFDKKTGTLIEKSTRSKAYSVCGVEANRTLKTPKVIDYIVKLRNEFIMKDDVVDSELAYVMTQNEELMPKVHAIKEYNKLRKRVNDDPGAGTKVLIIQISNESNDRFGDAKKVEAKVI